jgi:hypothetical protein
MMIQRLLLALLLSFLFIVWCNQPPKEKYESDVGKMQESAQNQDRIPTEPDGNLVIYVSNQSVELSSVDIDIRIDGILAIKNNFERKNRHRWQTFRFRIAEGERTLNIKSQIGHASLEKQITISDKLWKAIGYYYSEARKGGIKVEPTFSFDVRHSPIYFR